MPYSPESAYVEWSVTENSFSTLSVMVVECNCIQLVYYQCSAAVRLNVFSKMPHGLSGEDLIRSQ